MAAAEAPVWSAMRTISGGAAAVDHRVGELGGDDLAAQPVLLERVGEALGDRGRKIAQQLAPEIGIVRHRRVEQLGVERELGIGEQHRELRPGQRLRAPPALGELDVVGQELDRAVELAAGLEDLHQALLEAEVLEPAPLGERERQRLLVVVAQHEPRHVVGHLGEQRVARRRATAGRRASAAPARS